MSKSAPAPQAILFDLMGTCCDWLSSILPALQAAPPADSLPPCELPGFAAAWRAGFFREIHRRYEVGAGTEDIDVTHRRVLDQLLEGRGVSLAEWGEEVKENLVASWHQQVGKLKYFCVSRTSLCSPHTHSLARLPRGYRASQEQVLRVSHLVLRQYSG